MKYLLVLIFFLFSSPCFSESSSSFQNELSLKRLQEESLNIQNLDQEMRFSEHLREFLATVTKNPKENEDLRTYAIAFDYRQKMPQNFPTIKNEEYEKAGKSIGVALFLKTVSGDQTIQKNKVIDILLREARLLSGSAQILLKHIYSSGMNHFRIYDPRILAFFKEEAEKYHSPRGLCEYGTILLEGHGVPKDEKRGIAFLKESDLGDAHVILAEHYLKKNNKKEARFHLEKAASLRDPQGMYNLGVMEQEEGNFKAAIHLFNEVLEVESNYWAAHLELARMYIEGWGVEKDIKKGKAMLEEVANKSDDVKSKDLARLNLEIIEKLSQG